MRIRYVSFILKVRANRNSSETETEDKIRDQGTMDLLEHVLFVDSKIRLLIMKARRHLKTTVITVRMSEFSCIII